MTTSELLETHADGVVTLTLNRPERLNALTPFMVEALVDILPRLGDDPAVRASVLTGAGRGFCSGSDMAALRERSEGGYEKRVEWLRFAHQVPMLLATLPKIVIARVNGVAAGAGLSLALACDFRIASRSGRFVPAFGAIGLPGDYGGSWMLPRLVSMARAREIYLLNQSLDAAQAMEAGLLHRLVDDAALDAATAELARQVADGPTLAQGLMKRTLQAAETSSFAEVLDMEAHNTATSALTQDHREGLLAFAEKRRANFQGR